jgi:hypothetical protein
LPWRSGGLIADEEDIVARVAEHGLEIVAAIPAERNNTLKTISYFLHGSMSCQQLRRC